MCRVIYLCIFSLMILSNNFALDSDLSPVTESSIENYSGGDKELRKATKRAIKKKNKKKVMRSLKENNPELFAKFRAERKKWKNLSPEERRKARKAFMDANPELRKLLNSAAKPSARKVKNRAKNLNPEQADKLYEARQSWQNLSREERQEARKDFMKGNPEIRKSLRKFNKKRRKKSKSLESDGETSL